MNARDSLPVFGIPGKEDVSDIRDVISFIINELSLRHRQDLGEEYVPVTLHAAIQELGYTPSEVLILTDYLSFMNYVVRMPRKIDGTYLYYLDTGSADMTHCIPEEVYLVTLRNVVAHRKLAAENGRLRRAAGKK